MTLPIYIDGNVTTAVPAQPSRDVDGVIGRLAGRRHGIVTRVQLLAAGVTVGAIEHRVRRGRLKPVHRGVYAVGHAALSPHARVQAALLATAGVASHRTAAALYGLLPSMPAVVDVTITGTRRRGRPGLKTHVTTTAPKTRFVHGLEVTDPLTTLRALTGKERERATDEALARGLVRPAEIDRPPTRSHLEREMLRLIRAAGLPQPLVNHRHGPYLLDLYWPEHRLVVETDGRTHAHAAARRRDRARDAALAADGIRVIRFPTSEVTGAPLRVAAALGRQIAT